MIYSLIDYENNDTYFIQTNNPTEEILRKEDGKGFLESCGPTAAVNIVSSMGYNVNYKFGSYQMQPEQVLMDYFHDPVNYDKFRKIRTDINPKEYFNNRVPQFYPAAIEDLFGIKGFFEYKKLQNIDKLLSKNIGILICLIHPSHYVGIVAYDDVTNKVCLRDPWPEDHFLNKKSGFNYWVKKDELNNNLMNWRVLFGGKDE